MKKVYPKFEKKLNQNKRNVNQNEKEVKPK